MDLRVSFVLALWGAASVFWTWLFWARVFLQGHVRREAARLEAAARASIEEDYPLPHPT